jgi:hypothetical protein
MSVTVRISVSRRSCASPFSAEIPCERRRAQG